MKPLTKIKKERCNSKHHENCSRLLGDCSGLSGNLNEIPQSSRPCDINDWVEE